MNHLSIRPALAATKMPMPAASSPAPVRFGHDLPLSAEKADFVAEQLDSPQTSVFRAFREMLPLIAPLEKPNPLSKLARKALRSGQEPSLGVVRHHLESIWWGWEIESNLDRLRKLRIIRIREDKKTPDNDKIILTAEGRRHFERLQAEGQSQTVH